MTAIATGVFKTVAFKRQTALGTVAPGGASTGQYIRRTKSTIDLAKATFKSNEILVSQQRRDFRHGIRSVTGTISCELSVGGFQPFMESICRQIAQAAPNAGSQTLVGCVTNASGGVFNSTGTSWITDGFKLGDVVTSSGWTTTGVANNGHFGVITALTATAMTVNTIDGVPLATKVAGDPVTVACAATKKIFIPSSGQVKHYYTIEHWFQDIAQSELFTDVVIAEMQVKIPVSGMATVDFPCMGLNLTEAATEYFTSPTAAATGGIQAGVNGQIIVNGTEYGYITAAEFTVKGNYSPVGGVIGSVNDPDIYPGVIDVSGQLSVLFVDTTFADLFENETEFSISIVLTNASGVTTSAPNYTSFFLPRCKASGMSKDDGEKGITLTFPFTALEPISGATNTIDSTISIQDSTFV